MYEQIFKPLDTISKIFGTYQSKVRIFQCLISTTGIVLLSLYYFFYKLTEIVSTAYSLVVLRYFSHLIALVLIVIINLFQFGDVQNVLTNLELVDLELIRLGQNRGLIKINKSHKNWARILTFVFNVGANICGLTFSVLLRKHPEIIHLIVLGYPRIVLCNFSTTFFVLSMMIQDRFTIINTVLKKKNNFDSSIITRLVQAHSNLIKIIDKVNTIFNPVIIFFFAIDFILIVGDLYIISSTILFTITSNNKFMASLIKNCLFYTTELIYFTIRSAKLCREANRTVKILTALPVPFSDEKKRNLIIFPVMRLLQNRIKITAFGFFSLDYELLFSMCGTACSYLFIMLQINTENLEQKSL
ncbi:gustatory receptor 148 [Tribolium castaneum]|uniref:Gustatory receptor n=1 Tax=Tribolium castaneum TaxID=7070 RepID=D6X4A3_TRICA|nr:gustatory receptor 148 [Tribolium castaneum]